MAVVILALGATRRRASIAEAQAVLAAGQLPIVVVESLRSWHNDPIPTNVRTIEITALLRKHTPLRVEHAVLYGLPRRTLRLLGRGRLAPKAKKAIAAYERKFANRVHNRVVAPLHRRLWPAARTEMVRRAVDGSLDLVLVTDPASFTLAVSLATPLGDGGSPPRVTFGSGYVPARST